MKEHAIESLVRRATGAHTAVFEAPLQSLWSGYGEIRRVRLHGGGPATVIVKWVQPPKGAVPETRDVAHRRKLRSYAVEHHWYERHAPRCPSEARIARCHGCFRLAEGWVFVLEDLDAAGFAERRSVAGREDVLACLRWLAAFHAAFMQVEPAGLWPEGTYWHLATRAEELRRTRNPRLRQRAAAYDGRLRRAPYRTWVHGDAKVENFCFAHEELAPVAAVDFQYVGGGCGMRDVVYLLWGCLDAASLHAWAEEALACYFDELRRVLRRCHPELDGAAVEAAWRPLYAVAWADFLRFLAGWDPSFVLHDYDARMLEAADAGIEQSGT